MTIFMIHSNGWNEAQTLPSTLVDGNKQAQNNPGFKPK